MEVKKLYYTMGEVTEMFDVNASLIRYWEQHFDIIKPKRNKKGNRLFTEKDIENLKLIYHLVREKGMTLEGAQKSISQARKPYNRDAELFERLQRIRSIFLEIREELKGGDDQFLDDTSTIEKSALNIKIGSSSIITEVEVEPDDQPSYQNLKNKDNNQIARRRVKQKEVSQEKELFAYYEQSLFTQTEEND